MLSVCDDILLEDMDKEEELDLFIDESFQESIDTLFGYDGENTMSYDKNHGLLFPQPMTRYIMEDEL